MVRPNCVPAFAFGPPPHFSWAFPRPELTDVGNPCRNVGDAHASNKKVHNLYMAAAAWHAHPFSSFIKLARASDPWIQAQSTPGWTPSLGVLYRT